jgi:magnesium transporter
VIVHAHQIDEHGRLSPLPSDTASEAYAKGSAHVWIDLSDPEPSELERWLGELGIHALARRLCLEAGDRAGFYPLRDELVLVLRVLVDEEGAGRAEHLTLVRRDRLLLTVHRVGVLDAQQLASLRESDTWLPEPTLSGIVAAALIGQSLDCLQRVETIRNAVLAAEDRLDREPGSVQAEEILDLRSEVLNLQAIVAGQLPALEALGATGKTFVETEDAREYLSCARVNLKAADGALERLDERIGALRAGYQMYAQDATNRRLNMLTILSTIFLPMSFLTGLWGMNFVSMPELRLPFAYPLALGLIALVGWGMYAYFRRTGWFGEVARG